MLATCALHNMLVTGNPQQARRLANRKNPEAHAVTDGTWRQGTVLIELAALRRNNATNSGKAYRYLSAYVNSPAASVLRQEQQARHVH